MFNENLHNIYQDIYYMKKFLGFSPEYIERMSPAERKIYWMYYERDEAEKKKKMGGSVMDIPPELEN